jgi:hypothetical protein
MGSSQHSPSRIIPHFGKVFENNAESSCSEHRTVFDENISWSDFTNNPRHFFPETASGSVNSCALSGCADVLAGKSSRNHVNASAPWSSVKGANVIPNRERREKAVILSGGKYTCGVGLALNGADGFPSEEFAAQYAATSACE